MSQMEPEEPAMLDKYHLSQPRLMEFDSGPSTFAPQVQVSQKPTIPDANIKRITKKRPQLIVKKSSAILKKRT